MLTFKNVAGQGGSFKMSGVPLEMLQNMKLNIPIPITISGSSNVTFTVNGSVTQPAVFWTGDDFVSLKTTKAYTFTASATNTILASTGVVTALQNPVAGIWYFYMGYVGGTLYLYPSQTAPSYVEVGGYTGRALAHPGTSRTSHWAYVGFTICNATTPTFLAMTKLGYDYLIASTGSYTTIATTTTWSERELVLPKHGPLGLTVMGSIETGAAGTVTVGSTSSATVGVVKAVAPSASAAAFVPFGPLTPTANGKLWANDATARGDLHVTVIRDVV